MSATLIERQSTHEAMLTRCDACGAAAIHTVGTPARHLLFCQHHYDRHAPKLRQWIDYLTAHLATQ